MEIISRPSPNFGTRSGEQPTAIILHDTGGKTAESTLTWFSSKKSRVSAHYVIDRDGSVYQCVDLDKAAWHAGKSVLHGDPECNLLSIGIELVDDNDTDRYPDAQLLSTILLCADLCLEFRIPLNRVVGHADIAIPKGRKVDPNSDWPWFEFLSAVGTHISEKLITV